MKLVVCEKPSVGISYARALGGGTKKDGYIEGAEYIITWCIGHLIQFAEASVYDERYKKWNLADLPIIPKTWKFAVSTDKKKQFDTVKKLMNDSRITEVINACDAGREGELIFRLVYEKAGCNKPIKRLWLSSMEEKAIKDGFNNLHDGRDYDCLYQSALCRAKADFIVGINATRLFTKLYNKKLSVGRVQTPTLAMLTERNTAIEGFVKEKYFNVDLNDIAVSERFNDEVQAENVKASCDGKTAIVTAVKRETKSISPPKLYDLTTLQREANRYYGFSAQQTLDYAQSLYESRLITYPRSSSRYITEDMSESTRNIIKAVIQSVPQFTGLNYRANITRVIYNRKVADHAALTPTLEITKVKLDELPDGERKILMMIAGRLLCATADKHEYEAVTATLECCGFSFTAKGKSIISDGWKTIEAMYRGTEKADEDGENNNSLDLTEGQEITSSCVVSEHFTKPPRPFTEDTLLNSMQKASADEQRDAAPKSGSAGDNAHEWQGLGTPATRASIIEKLVSAGFIKRDKKNIIATPDGAELISIMPEVIKSAQLTADWENGLALIADGTLSPEKFMSDIEIFIKDIISSAKANVNPDKVAKSSTDGGEVIGKCIRCGGNVWETPKAYACSSACGFLLWKNNKFFETAKKPFTKAIATALLGDGKVEVKGLYSPKKDKLYDAFVCLEDTGRFINFKLQFEQKG